MVVSLRRTVGSAIGMLLVAGAIGVGGSAFAGPVEDGQLLSAINGVRVSVGAPALVTDSAAAGAARTSLTSVLAGGSVLSPVELSAAVGPSGALTAFALTGADVYEAADVGFSDPATGAALRDPGFTSVGIASDYSAAGDFVAVVVLRAPAPVLPPAPSPTTSTPPAEPSPTAAAPSPSEPAPTPTAEPSTPVATTPPTPTPEPTPTASTGPAASPAPDPAATPTASPQPASGPAVGQEQRARAHAADKTEHFGKFSGDKLTQKLQKVADWLERTLSR